MERILVAMSGGVDSSVAALLLKSQGFEVVGAYMKNWINEDNVIGHCPWMQDIDDARAVADRIGIEFRVVNLMQDYRRLVVDYLLDGYQRGLTPNPDVMCNSRVKFGVFRAYAEAEGFTALATGHYARRVEEPVWAGCPHPAEGRRHLSTSPMKQMPWLSFLAAVGSWASVANWRSSGLVRWPMGKRAKRSCSCESRARK